MHAFVRFVLPDDSRSVLAPGDIIGRSASAALAVDDGRVSEAHALVSLRGAELQLLSLRGRFAVDGAPQSSVALVTGQVVSFAEGLDLRVEAVHLPPSLPALAGDGLPAQCLHGTASLLLGPPVRLLPRHDPAAAAHLWLVGERWRLAVPGQATRTLGPEQSFELGGRRFELTTVRVERAGVHATEAVGGIEEALTLVTAWDSVLVRRSGRSPALLGGQAARIVSVLASVGGTLAWDGLARELWPQEEDRAILRRSLDVALSRLRARLRAIGVRSDLVRASGAGHVVLVLRDGDRLLDES